MSSVSPDQRVLSGRRLALLASAAGLAAVLVFSAQPFAPALNSLNSPAYAQSAAAQRPAGFADIVEKVKPSVISVRVKMNTGPQTSGLSSEDDQFGQNSPFEQFFRRFGRPDG